MASTHSVISLDRFLEKGIIPDALVRYGIRRLLRQRLRDEAHATQQQQQRALSDFVAGLREMPVAINTAEANEQHYEVPAAFYQHCLGPHLKYSCGYWPEEVSTLEQAEEAMLRLSCQRAGIDNGQSILELGCGWGSLTLWMASHYPESRITAVSNSQSQRQFIEGQAKARGLNNVRVITADMNDFEAGDSFDRVVSVEMFEHMKNYQTLFERVSRWLVPDGHFFLHIFTHRTLAYHFTPRDQSDWMSRYFFSGGMMPSDSLPLYFQDDLALEEHWHVDGVHYARTAEAWLDNMDRARAEILPIFIATYGEAGAEKWWNYWRIFFLSCAELWGYRSGREWFVSHYRFRPR